MRSSAHGIRSGFTIVELLIVIVVIGILAALVLNSFAGAQDKAREAKVKNDIAVLDKAARAARISSGKTLMQITGRGCTGCSCPYSGGDLTQYNSLPKSHNCWVAYFSALDAIGAAAGTTLDQLKEGDPWGSPYFFDENEGENGGCNKDTIRSVGKSSNINGGTAVGWVQLPLVSAACI